MSLPDPLPPDNAATLAAASPEAIVDAAGRLSRYMAHGRWLGTQNVFAFNVVDAAKARFGDQVPTKSAKQFAEWVAASGPVHCLEGWSYLGRSFAALLAGDVDSARHLAYYAELRGAVSILATCGISILNNAHYAVHSDGTVHRISKLGTHDAAWLYLDHWSKLPDASTTVGEIVRPSGIALSDWLAYVPGGGSWQPVASQWLRDLGMDIEAFSSDRTLRNESSYRPMALRRRNRPRIRDATHIVNFVIDTWRTLEPEAAPFASVDKQFLRLSLERAFCGTTGQRPSSDPARYLSTIDAVLAAQSISRLQAETLRDFLKREVDPDDAPLLAFAAGSSAPSDPGCHFNVLSRAALMLRMATGASTRMLRAAEIQPRHCSFWWSRIGLDAGLWPETPDPEDVAEYWVEISESLQVLEEWAERGPETASESFHDLVRSCGGNLHKMAAMEIVGVIGVVA